MAVVGDGEALLSGIAASNTTWTLSGKTTAGTNRVGILRFKASLDPSSAPTWGGNAMTSIGTAGSGATLIRAYQIVNPPTASSDISVTFPGAQTGQYIVSSYNNVDQTTPIAAGSFAAATGSSTTPSVDVTSATGHLVLDAMLIQNVITTQGAGQTAEFIDTVGGSDRFGASKEAGAGTVTMSWTAGSASWSILGFSLAEAGGGGGGATEPGWIGGGWW